MSRTLTTTTDDHRIAWLAALAVAIHVAEAALPSPIPGVKPGLANVIIVAVLLQYGLASAAWVSVLRVLAASLLIGTFLSPTFWLSLAGTVAALGTLALGTLVPGRGFSAIGYSLLAAMAHMAGQFTLAYWVFIPHPALLALLPVLMTASVLFGIVNGIIVNALMDALGRSKAPDEDSSRTRT